MFTRKTSLITLSFSLLLSGCQTFNKTSDHTGVKTQTLASISLEDPVPFKANESLIKRVLSDDTKPFDLEENRSSLPLDNLWDQIAIDFDLIYEHQPHYQEYLAFYLNNPRHFEHTSSRAEPYLFHIYQAVQERNLPMELTLLPVIESSFIPYARSHMSAVGLWQFIPSTGRNHNLAQNSWFDGRQDIHLSTQAALNYLEKLYKLNDQDWLLALASYNAGYGRILQAKTRLKKTRPGTPPTYWNLRPYLPKETRDYVPKLLAVSYLHKYHHDYDLPVKPVANKAYLAKVELEQQFSLQQAAKLAQIDIDLLRHLNPGYLKQVSPPEGPHTLLLPIENLQVFEQAKRQSESLYAIRWQNHRVQAGDTLGHIALKYGTSVAEIRLFNNLTNTTIRLGRNLTIPIPATQFTTHTQLVKQHNANPSFNHNHQVRAGQSLWTIAKDYQVSVAELVAWNDLNPQRPLQIGQLLNIASVATIANSPTEYIVKRGDTLWDIARTFNVNTRDLQRHNRLNPRGFLRPGQVIKIVPGS